MNSARSLKVLNGRCAALVGDVPGARCGIYERRPVVCRGFKAGSQRCRLIRARVGLAPFPDGKAR